VQAGDAIAQLICERIAYPKLIECTKLSETTRDAAGFGEMTEKMSNQ